MIEGGGGDVARPKYVSYFWNRKTGEHYVGLVNTNVNIKIYKTVDICALLGFYIVYVGSWLPAFQDNLSVQATQYDRLSLEVGTDRLSRNARNILPIHAA